MIHFALPVPRSRRAPIALPPITPAAYLRLRRKAAGLTVFEVARRMKGVDHDPAMLVVNHLETEGMKALHRSTIETLAEAFPFDIDVYWQLRDTPADQHPRICRGCGCSEYDACVAADLSHSCAWAGPATCTRCVDTPSIPVHQ